MYLRDYRCVNSQTGRCYHYGTINIINAIAHGLFKLKFLILASLAWQLEVPTAEFDVRI